MAKFSVGRLEEGEGPSGNSKRQRTALHRHPQTNLRDGDEEEETHHQEDDDGRVNNGGNGEKADLDLAGPSGNGPFSVTVTDPEVFDCPICYESLTTPVFQCENGHIACSTCCSKIMNKCPSCCTPIGYNRCRAIEKVLESVKVTCQNSNYGCQVTMSYGKKHDHEKICFHVPCSCPIPDCNFVGSANHLYKHFSAKHKNSAVHFPFNEVVEITLNVNSRFIVLQEEEDGVLFILNSRSESLGHVISVSCIAPSWKGYFFYSILAGPAGSTVRFQSFTKNIQNRVDNPPSTGFLLVPIESFGSSGDLKLELCISPQHVSRVIV